MAGRIAGAATRMGCATLLAVTALAQQTAVFRSSSNLVVVDVFVRDKSGKEITDLKKSDFVVLEDGKPQQIAVFELQRLAEPAAPAPAPARALAETRPGRPRPQVITTASPGKVQYQDRRLIVLFFDLSAMQPADQVRAQKAARKFLREQMTPADMVAVMTFASDLKVIQDFTNDRDALETAVRSFVIGEGSEQAATADTGDSTSGEDNGAAFVADESEFNIFNTDRKLSALESAAKMLSGLPEKKALVYFSSGIAKTGVENQSQLRSTVNEAVRANVAFYPVDARGLTALVPGGDASHAASRGSGLFSGAAQNSQRQQFNDQQETLVSLAEDTGGKALLDNNDLGAGIRQAQQDIRSYYIVGYYSANPAQDGKYRRIQVKVAPQLQAKLDFRSGYFAPKEFGKFTAADKESQLEQALMLGDPVTDLPLALEVNYFRLGRGQYFVPAAVKIPGSEVVLAKKGGSETTEFDFIGQVRDEHGRPVSSVRDGIQVKLDDVSVAQLERRNFEYDTGFVLEAGTYDLKFLARENQTGKMGTFETRFTVPDMRARSDYLRLSSVVWSSQREPMAAAVGTAGQREKVLAMNPLVDDAQKLVPSITRVFRNDQNLYVYLEAYDATLQAPQNKPALVAALSVYRGKVKAFESAPVRLTELAPKRGNTARIRFQVPLKELPPGRYTCQVSVVDELGKKFAFSRALIAVLPPAEAAAVAAVSP
jgi:VWFA-related protein